MPRRSAPAFPVAALLSLAVLGAACERPAPIRYLDTAQIAVVGEPRLRTDRIGVGDFEGTATFVLVDAENRGATAADVTLGGALRDAGGAVLGPLKPESLWIPAGERRTFALVDQARQVRPGAAGVQVLVRGAVVPPAPPIMRITDLHLFDDFGKAVVQASLTNDADRSGQAVVIAAFHDREGRPMTRPFSVIPIGPRITRTVRFVGPEGSARGTIFLGDLVY